MNTPNPLLDSLRSAVLAAPDDLPLRLHLAELLISRAIKDEAVGHIAAVLAKEPANAAAAKLMALALQERQPSGEAERTRESKGTKEAGDTREKSSSFDWSAAESELADVIPPKFVDSEDPEDTGDARDARDTEDTDAVPERVRFDGDREHVSLEVERTQLRLADVGGMEAVKKRLNAAFLEPMRNPKLRKLYGKSLRGGLLLYGPPGCGKTFIAKAVAGELGAKFLAVGLHDVLDVWLGKSERNMHEIFQKARESAPCVLFFDELDGLGHKRANIGSSGIRNAVNQLLVELDGVADNNDGVFVLAATNTPWDVDVALRRPGRFDRTVLVLPPDEAAREAILQYHLRDRPVSGINLRTLARRTEGLSGADLAYLCEAGAERALMASVESGEARMIEMDDMLSALSGIPRSTRAWFTTARNVALYANQDGVYNDLLAYLKKNKLL